MVFRIALKQLLRTPVKSLLFLLLLALSAALLVTGVNLFVSSTQSLEAISEQYETVGTIRQLPDSTRTEAYTYFEESQLIDLPEYTTVLPDNLFQGLPTLLPVENRPVLFTTATREDGVLLNTASPLYPVNCVTFIPLENGDSGDAAFLESHAQEGAGFSLPVEIQSISWETPLAESAPGLLLWPEDLERYPAQLQAGVTYIAYSLSLSEQGTQLTFSPSPLPLAVEAGKTSMEWREASQLIYEVTPEFEESEPAQAFASLANNRNSLVGDYEVPHLFPTVPTNSLSLLDPFYQGDVTIKYGREITPAEFASGAHVCLIPESLATDPAGTSSDGVSDYYNYLEVGDMLSLTYHGAAYGSAPSSLFPGREYPISPFYTGEPLPETAGETYEIVGIYTSQRIGVGGYESELNLAYNEVIVPAASFDFDSVPAVWGGPLQASNVSFQLENGTVEEFMNAVSDLEWNSLLSVEISDQGYSTAKKSLDAVFLAAFILLAAGGASTLCLLVFFVYLQISRQRREAAIHISLGAGKRRCAALLLSTVLFISLPGIAAGTAGGWALAGAVSRQVYEQAKSSGYSRAYSDQLESSGERDFDYSGASSAAVSLAAGGTALGCALLLTGGVIFRTLKREPLELLSQP